MATTELTVNADAQREPTFLEVIASAARDPQVDVAKMSALLELKERVDAKQAEIEFNRAMARLQPRLPRIKKNGTIDLGRGKPLTFAKWEDIDTAIRPIVTSEGFTLSFTSEPTPAGVLMVCTVSHILGHSKSSKMQLPADSGPGRNGLQAIGSSRSYGKRYLTCDMLNIVTEGADDDGNSVGFITDQQSDSIMSLIDECGMDAAAQSKFLEFMSAKAISEIQARDFKKAITALEAKRRQGRR